jgi:peptide/nickel transport system ATP-binding protein
LRTIGMALALDPPMMILDEPTTALDVVVQKEIMQQIEDLKTALGFSILFITHDLSLLVEFSDRIAIMYAGQIVELAPAPELFANPLHPYTKGLMSSFPTLTGEKVRLTGIPGSPPDMARPPSGCRFHPRCPKFKPMHAEVVPPLREIRPGHWVACHLYEQEGPWLTSRP